MSVNEYTITDTFQFADEIHEMIVNVDSIIGRFFFVTNVPLDETVVILAEKAFTSNWFNEKYNLEIIKSDLIQLLRVAKKYQLFQFDGKLYDWQADGVAMGSPLGPVMANTFMCSIEENLKRQDKMTSFYKRSVDETLTIVRDVTAAIAFLKTFVKLPSFCPIHHGTRV